MALSGTENGSSGPEDAAAEAANIADGVTRPLDPLYVDLERQTGWIASAVVTVIALVGTTIFMFASHARSSVVGLVGIAIASFLVALTWFWQRWPAIEYPYASYRVDADGLEIRRGVYFRTVTTVPRSRVQHTDVSQGPLQRRYGLATLTVHTAGTNNSEVELPGLPHETALRIRDHLLPGNTADAV